MTMEAAINERAIIGDNCGAFDFLEFFDRIVNASMSGPEKLTHLVIARLAHKNGGTAAPKREEVLRQASCSEATFKRSFGLLKAFFEVDRRAGTTTKYEQKPVPTQDEIELAIISFRRKTRDHSDTGIKSTRDHSDTDNSEKLRVTVIPGSKTRDHSDTNFFETKGHGDTELDLGDKKKNPPTPPLKKNKKNKPPLGSPKPIRMTAKRGDKTRLSPDWQLCSEWRQRTRIKFGATDAQIDKEADRFKRYWLSPDAKNPMKADWLATWENWFDRAMERGISVNGAVNGSQYARNGQWTGSLY